jgi:hypothetical protein
VKTVSKRIEKGGGKARKTGKEKVEMALNALRSVRNSKTAKEIQASAEDARRWNSELKLFQTWLGKR